tara:strand:+ start:776 stop:1033 length:258 start_codon:yes stop_codon:yes gene_type:complete
MKKRIHVNRHHVAYNKKHRNDPDFTSRPPITVKTYKGSMPTDYVRIIGDVRLVYMPSNPLSCGATIWMETDDDVYVGLPNKLIGE